MLKQISKNKDNCTLVNFRLRQTDLDALDRFAAARKGTRTAAVEYLIREFCICEHLWVQVNETSSVCSHCKEWQE